MPFGASWRASWRSLASYAPLLGALGSVSVAFVTRNYQNFGFCINFSPKFRRFACENAAKACENTPKTCEYLITAPRTLRRNPTRARRSREANSIRRTRRLRRERSVLNNDPNRRTRGACLPLPLHQPPCNRRPPRCEEYFLRSGESLLLLTPQMAFLGALGGSWAAPRRPLLALLGRLWLLLGLHLAPPGPLRGPFWVEINTHGFFEFWPLGASWGPF